MTKRRCWPPTGATVRRPRSRRPDAEIVIERACGPHLAARAAAAGVRRLGFESHVVTVDGFAALREGGGRAVELVRAAGTVEALREVKDAGEIALLRLACEAADAALADLVERGGLCAGPDRERGGPRTRVADARPRRRRGVVRDHRGDRARTRRFRTTGRPTRCWRPATSSRSTSARWSCGYHSDMTRTFVLSPAAQWQLDVYDLVAAAQRAGREALAPGASLKDVDGASRQVIADAGYADNFGHGLGHGVGLQIHEAPGISASAAGTLLAGSAVTVEPGVYLPGRGGVRIEDTLVVGSDGQGTPNCSPGSPRNWPSSEQENDRTWHRPPTSRMGSSCRSTASCGRSSSSSTSSRARARPSCGPS